MEEVVVEGGGAVEGVAQEGVAYRREVDSDLVASGVVGAKLDERALFRWGAAQHFCLRRLGAEPFELAGVGADPNLPMVVWVGRDGRFDDDRSWNDSYAARKISLFDFSGLQHSS